MSQDVGFVLYEMPSGVSKWAGGPIGSHEGSACGCAVGAVRPGARRCPVNPTDWMRTVRDERRPRRHVLSRDVLAHSSTLCLHLMGQDIP
eukprot:4533868-Prymnesium_polylepis.4